MTSFVSARYNTVGNTNQVLDPNDPVDGAGNPSSSSVWPAANEVAIRAAALTMSTVSPGGGIVNIPATTITLTAPLPMYKGVVYRGAGYAISSPTIADSQVTYTSGTRLLGNGTFNAFEGNAVDGGAPFSTQGAYTDAALTGAGLENLLVQNFKNGCKIGSNYNPGAHYSRFYNICALDCTEWGFWFENMIHVSYRVYAFGNTLGQVRFRSSSVSSTFQPANCFIEEICVTTAPGAIKSRGIVISTANGTIGGISYAAILQSNRFAPGTTSQAVTMASGSANITVPDITKFAIGMPVAFDATQNGFTKNVIYFIASISGSVVTLSAQLFSAALVASGATAVNLTSQGFPCLEVVPDDSNANNQSTLAGVGNLDLEAGGTCKLLVQRPAAGFWVHMGAMQPDGSTQDICLRNTNNMVLTFVATNGALNLDNDQTGTGIQYYGTSLGVNSVGVKPAGLYGSNVSGRSMNLARNFSSTGGNLGGSGSLVNKAPGGGDFTYPGVPIGQHTYPAITNTALSLSSGIGAGCIAFRGTSNGVWTLPTLTTDFVGLPFEIANCSITAAVTLTVQSGNGELMNLQTGKTSFILALGQWIRLVAQENGSGGFFWQVMTNGT